jgi:hypothetical protein
MRVESRGEEECREFIRSLISHLSTLNHEHFVLVVDQRADFLAEDGVADGVFGGEIENEDRHIVIEAEREGR